MTMDGQSILLLILLCLPIYWLVWKAFYGDMHNFLGSIGTMLDWEMLFNPRFAEGNRALIKLMSLAGVCIFLSWQVRKKMPAILSWFEVTMGSGGG